MAQVEAEAVHGLSVSLGVQSRCWVSRRLRPCSRRASEVVRRGVASGNEMTVVVVARKGITVVNLSLPEQGGLQGSGVSGS